MLIIMNKPKSCNFIGCKRRLKLFEYELKCKCENLYCSKHRFPENHECIYFQTKFKPIIDESIINELKCEFTKLEKI